MENLPLPILSHIVDFFPWSCRPWFRLVCKKWAKCIKYRVCEASSILDGREIITIDFIKTLKEYFRGISERCVQLIFARKYWIGKIQVLDYIVAQIIEIPSNPWIIKDIETFEWFKSKYGTFDRRVVLNEYLPDVWNYCKQHGHCVRYSLHVLIPLDVIDQLEMSKYEKVVFLAKHDVIYTDMKGLDVEEIFECAIFFKAKKLLKFLMDSYSYLHIHSHHYLDVDDHFKDHLLTLRQDFPEKWDRKANNFYDLPLQYLQIFYHRYPRSLDFWLVGLLYNRIDFCEFLEWHGHTLKPDALNGLLDFIKINPRVSPTVKTLLFCQRRNLIFPREYINFIANNCSEESIHWILDNNFVLSSDAYLNIVGNYGSLDTLIKLENSGIIPVDSMQFQYEIYKRNNPEITKFFSKFDIKPFAN